MFTHLYGKFIDHLAKCKLEILQHIPEIRYGREDQGGQKREIYTRGDEHNT